MKTIYLKDENRKKVSFNYENISELKEELEKRKISIGDDTMIGNNVTIDYGAIIKDGVNIGERSRIGFRAIVRDNSMIRCDVRIGYGSIIGEDVIIGDRARIRDYVIIGNEVIIGDGGFVDSSMRIRRRLYRRRN